MTGPEPRREHPETVIEDLQESLEKAIENTAEPAKNDAGGPVVDKNAPAS